MAAAARAAAGRQAAHRSVPRSQHDQQEHSVVRIQKVWKGKQARREVNENYGFSFGDKKGTGVKDEVAAMIESMELERQTVQHVPFVESDLFSTVIGIVILVNTLVMGLSLDGLHCEPDMSEAACEEQNAAPNVWWTIETIFILIFTFEIILRLHTSRLAYFKNVPNLVDFGLVALAIADSWVMTFALQEPGSNLKAFQVLRMFRYFRLVRIVRLLRFFQELTLLCEGLLESVRALSWVALLMLIWIYTFSVFLRQLLLLDDQEALDKEYTSHGCTWGADSLWGSIPECMWTLLQVVTMDAWSSKVVRPILARQPAVVIIFIIFIFVGTFGLLNVAVGVIVETTLGTAAIAKDRLLQAQNAEQRYMMHVLIDVFELADANGDKMLSLEEFETAWRTDKSVREKLEQVELDMDEAKELFALLDDDNTGEVSIEEFFKGLIKLKGNAKGRDMIQLTTTISYLQKQLFKMDERATRISERMTMTDQLATEILETQDRVFKALGIEAIDVYVPIVSKSSPPADIDDSQAVNRLDALEMVPALHVQPGMDSMEYKVATVEPRRLGANGVHQAAPVTLNGLNFNEDRNSTRLNRRWSGTAHDKRNSQPDWIQSVQRKALAHLGCGQCEVCEKASLSTCDTRRSSKTMNVASIREPVPPEPLIIDGGRQREPNTKGAFLAPRINSSQFQDDSKNCAACLEKDKGRIQQIREQLASQHNDSLVDMPEEVVMHYLIVVWEILMSKRGVWRTSTESDRSNMLSESQQVLRSALMAAARGVDAHEDPVQVQSVVRLLLGAGAGSKGREQSEYLCQAMAMLDTSSDKNAAAAVDGDSPQLDMKKFY